MDNLLIAAVYSREPIWNPANDFHKNSNILKKLWKEVAEELQKDVKTLKTRWKNLRTYFIKECQKLEKLKNKKGGGLRTWQYFDQLQFLRNSTTVLNKIAEDDDDDDNYKECYYPNAFLDQSSPAHSSVSDNLNIVHPMKREYTTNGSSNDQELELKRRKIELLEKDFDRRSNDDLLFFESLLPYMKDIPAIRKIQLRSKIQELIMKELDTFDSNTISIKVENSNKEENMF